MSLEYTKKDGCVCLATPAKAACVARKIKINFNLRSLSSAERTQGFSSTNYSSLLCPQFTEDITKSGRTGIRTPETR